MRACAVVSNGRAIVHVPHNGNRASTTETCTTSKPDGVYRASVTWEENRVNVTIGARVDASKEAVRLAQLARRPYKDARTHSPGIAGYQERERASQGAQAIAKQTTGNLANLFALAAARTMTTKSEAER